MLSGSRFCVWSLARSLPLWRRSPSRGAHGAAACGAALALLAPAWSCRRARGGVALGRRSSVAAARSFGAVRSARRLALSACRRWRGRFLSGAVAVARRSRRRCLRHVTFQPRRPPRPTAARVPVTRRNRQNDAATSSAQENEASDKKMPASLLPIPVTKPTATKVCGAPGAGMVVPPHPRRRDARPPLFRGGGFTLGAVRSAQRLALSACGRWRGRFLSGGGRRRAALTAPLPAAPRWRSWRRLSRAAALAAA